MINSVNAQRGQFLPQQGDITLQLGTKRTGRICDIEHVMLNFRKQNITESILSVDIFRRFSNDGKSKPLGNRFATVFPGGKQQNRFLAMGICGHALPMSVRKCISVQVMGFAAS